MSFLMTPIWAAGEPTLGACCLNLPACRWTYFVAFFLISGYIYIAQKDLIYFLSAEIKRFLGFSI